jgi:hypothetical protein
MERELFNAMQDLLTVLIQLQKQTRHVSVIRKSNSSTNLSLLPLRLSGSHLNLKLNLKESLREQLNIPVKY